MATTLPSRSIVTKFYLIGAAVTTAVAGYVSLWAGGTTSAAALLVLAYLVLGPVAIWRCASPIARVGAERPPYGAAALVGVAVLALYVATLAPTTAMWDASEYIAVARVLGLPHPPGNPTFVLLAHVAGAIPIPVSYAQRINLLAAAASAASAALWFLCGHHVLRGLVPDRRWRLAGGVVCATLGATAFTVWNQSVVNEKVYTVSLVGLALTSWLTLRWLARQRQTKPASDGADGLLLLVAYLTGVGYTVHPAGLLAAPAAACAVLVLRPSILRRWRLLVGLVATFGVGLTLFAVEPIRSAHRPAINEGFPTACEEGAPRVACTFSGETWRRLGANLRREQYGGHPILQRQAPLDAQLTMFWGYFRWQWLRDVHARTPWAQSLAALTALCLGLAGLAALRRHDRDSFWFFAPLAVTLTAGLVVYLNFNYAPAQSLELGDAVAREVRDRDYFFVWTFSVWGLWMGIGLVALWRAIGRAARRAGSSVRVASIATAPVLALALVPLLGNWSSASRAGQRFTREWALDMLRSVEPYAVLITNGDNDSFPLWYAQQVEGVRRDVTVTLTPYLGLPWYGRELLRHRPETYDAARGPAEYRDRTWSRPSLPLWRLTPSEADAIPDVVELAEPQRFGHGAMQVVIQARWLTRDQLLVLRAIKDSFPARPIYFSLGNYAQQLGLAPYLRRVGLVQKLEPVALTETPNLVPLSDAHLDLQASTRLWEQEYRGHRQLVREGRWLDASSASIPSAYAFVGQQLAAGHAARGDTLRARAVLDTVRDVAAAAGLLAR